MGNGEWCLRALPPRSADFQVCCIAGFQTRARPGHRRRPGWSHAPETPRPLPIWKSAIQQVWKPALRVPQASSPASSGGVSPPSPVAQAGSLLCRRLATCGGTDLFQRSNHHDALPAASRRHSRLPVCAARISPVRFSWGRPGRVSRRRFLQCGRRRSCRRAGRKSRTRPRPVRNRAAAAP